MVVNNKKQIITKVSMLLEKPVVILLEEYSDFVKIFSITNTDIFFTIFNT